MTAQPTPASPASVTPTRPLTAWWPELIALVVFSALLVAGILRHDMWFDELQAWNIARSSRSLVDVVTQLRYEGHPILWYLPLYLLTRFTGDPRAMQALELTIAIASVAMVLFRSPYARWLRITLCATYFLAFEYTVMSRSYGLGLLCFLVALDLLARPTPRWRAGTVALVLLSWTSLFGAALAGAVAVSLYVGSDAVPRVRWSRVDTPSRRLAAWVVVSCAAVAVSCIPPSDLASAGPAFGGDAVYLSGPLGRVLEGASFVWRGLAPVQFDGVWNTNVLNGSGARVLVAVALGFVLAVLIARGLAPTPLAVRMWVIGLGALAVFFVVVVQPTESRYTGYVALVLLGATWFAAARDASWLAEVGSIPRVALAIVLVAQLAATVGALHFEGHRFAPNETLARAAEARGVATRLVSSNDFLAMGVAAYVDHDVFSIAQHEWRRTYRFDVRQRKAELHMTYLEVWCPALQLARASGAPAGVLTSWTGLGPPAARVGAARLYLVEPDATIDGC